MSEEDKYGKGRRDWVAARRSAGQQPYPNDFRRSDLIAQVRTAAADLDRDALETADRAVAVAGRLMSLRRMGATAFAVARDMSGDLQLMVGADFTAADALESFAQADVGDIVGARGRVTRTMKGELTIRVAEFSILVKSLHPLPKEFYGLKDIEQRYRKRYLDLILNPAGKKIFEARAAIISAIRDFLEQRQFIEAETPMMQPLAGGATARPFVTRHNALDIDLYLRIAPELYLKRLVVGGMEKVYEINRNFRNEGVSAKHNPEFTMLEFYQAYADYKDLMVLSEEMLRRVCRRVNDDDGFEYQGARCDLSKPFARLTMDEALLKFNPQLGAGALDDRERLAAYAASHAIKDAQILTTGLLKAALFEKTAEERLQQPTFITAFPLDASPLARRSDSAPDTADRFELFICGMEIANGFSELNDADDQKQRLQQQAAAKAAGDDEAMLYDGDYVEALEYGLPPTAGEGIGIDRLVMLLTDSASIRDVILFPLLRPKKAED